METLNFGLFLVLFVPGTAGLISCMGTYWDSWHWSWKSTIYFCDGTCCGTYDDKCCLSSSSIVDVKNVYNQYTWVAVGVTAGVIVFCVIIGTTAYFLCKTTNRGSRSRTVHPSRNPNTQTTSFGPGIVHPPPYSIAAPPPPAYYSPVTPTASANKLGHHPPPRPQTIQVQPVPPEGAAHPSGSEPDEAVTSFAPRSTVT